MGNATRSVFLPGLHWHQPRGEGKVPGGGGVHASNTVSTDTRVQGPCHHPVGWKPQLSFGLLWHHLMKTSLRYVDQWLLVPIQSQQESPIWGEVKKETLFRAKQLNHAIAWLWKQHSYRTAIGELWGQAPLELDSSAPCFALLWSAPPCSGDIFGVSALPWRGDVWFSKPEGSWLIWTEVPIPGS